MSRKRRESALENQVVSKTDDNPKEAKYWGVVEVSARDLQVGDRVASRVDKFGKPQGIMKVEEIEVGVRGCQGIHVNKRHCYDGILGTALLVVSQNARQLLGLPSSAS